jgi:hypothetical protein
MVFQLSFIFLASDTNSIAAIANPTTVGPNTMQVSKTKAYFFLVVLLGATSLLYQGIWLLSRTTTGEVLDFGRGSGRGFKHVENVTIRYVVGNEAYVSNYLINGLDGEVQTVGIKSLTLSHRQYLESIIS